MKHYLFLLLAVFVIGLAACGGGSNTSSSRTDDVNASFGTPFLVEKPTGDKLVSEVYVDTVPDWTWDLIAGQTMNVGTVVVYNTKTTMYIKYQVTGGWLMKDCHAYVGDTPPSGVPGSFPFKKEFATPVSAYTFEIPLGSLVGKSQVYVATHTTVTQNGKDETAWGGYWNNGSPKWDFGFKNKWGGGFNTKVMPTHNYPTDWVTYKAQHPGTECYWNIVFQQPYPKGDYIVTPGPTWTGWCVDGTHSMYANAAYKVKQYSCYNPSLPAFAQSKNWDLISYLITQRRAKTGIYNKDWKQAINKNTFQVVVWYFMGDGKLPANYPYDSKLAQDIIADAKAKGENFIPGKGQYYGVILYPDVSTNNNTLRAQMNIIEVDP